MCVAVPGRVISVEEKYAQVEFGGNIIKARTGLIDVKPEDRVLVHAGYIIQTLSKSDAEEMEELMRLMEQSEK